ncbi:MAG: hypothetical protein IT343_21010, partial [Candidatus Melainabacteria bacterium]|nr:hypothetical protein [Candidatus Melainabacteria bacterium]
MRKAILSVLTVSLLFGCAAPKPKVDISAEDKAVILTKPELVSGEAVLDMEKMSRE